MRKFGCLFEGGRQSLMPIALNYRIPTVENVLSQFRCTFARLCKRKRGN